MTALAPEAGRDVITAEIRLSAPGASPTCPRHPDGSPQVSIVWVGLDGDEIVSGHLGMRQKLRNIGARPAGGAVARDRPPQRHGPGRVPGRARDRPGDRGRRARAAAAPGRGVPRARHHLPTVRRPAARLRAAHHPRSASAAWARGASDPARCGSEPCAGRSTRQCTEATGTSRADIVAERRRFAGHACAGGRPAAPSLAGAWTAEDVAAHVVSLDRLGGVPTFLGRTAVARGHRLNDATGRLAEASMRSTRHQGFVRVLDRLRAAPPRLLMRDGVAPVGLFEVFVHHEDVRRASGRWSPRATPEGLASGAVVARTISGASCLPPFWTCTRTMHDSPRAQDRRSCCQRSDARGRSVARRPAGCRGCPTPRRRHRGRPAEGLPRSGLTRQLAVELPPSVRPGRRQAEAGGPVLRPRSG